MLVLHSTRQRAPFMILKLAPQVLTLTPKPGHYVSSGQNAVYEAYLSFDTEAIDVIALL